MSVSQWAEEHVELPATVTNYPGRLDLDFTPYAREPLDAYGDPAVDEIVICGAAQVFKTLFQQCCMSFTIAHDPAPMLLVMPNEPDAKDFSKTRLIPLFEACDDVASQIDDRKKLASLSMRFRRCNFNIVGSNSPARLSSRPVGRLFLDELDKFAEATAKESSAVNLALSRTRTFGRAKVCYTSTPSLDTGDIWLYFKAGDQRYYFVPCPQCGEFDKLEWKNVRWSSTAKKPNGEWDLDAVKATACYVCPHCKERVTDDDKPGMLAAGEWRPTAVGVPGRRSYHLSGIYAPWASFGKLAVEWLSKKDDPDDLRDFLNSVLAQPWQERVESPASNEVLACRESYPPGYAPFEPLEVVITADKQLHGYWYVVRAWGEKEISAKLEHGFTETDESLLEIAATQYQGPTGPIFVTRRGMDSGDWTDEVYKFCRENGWQAIKGDAQGAQTFPAKFSPNEQCGQLLIVKTEFCKDAIERKIAIPNDRPGAWLLDETTGRDYADQITAEKKIVAKDKKGRPKHERKVTGPNHLLDCEVYNYAIACMRRVRYRTVKPKQPVDDESSTFVRQPKRSHFGRESDR